MQAIRAGKAPQPATGEQINAEVFALTYGSIIRQLLADLEDLGEVNKQLDKMGYNIGIRLIDEFLAKSKISRCGSFRETVDIIAKQAFFMFLNMQCTVSKWTQDGTECSLLFTDNPLTEFVELPAEFHELQYCNILCGVIRGALEMVNMDVEARVVGDMLKGDEVHELRLKLKEHKNEEFPYKDEES